MSRWDSGRSRAYEGLAESHHRDESVGAVTINDIRKADRKRDHLPRSHDQGMLNRWFAQLIGIVRLVEGVSVAIVT